MNESFVQQLEERAQQHRKRIATLEQQRAHIDGLIREMEALLPHYEALITAEKALVGSSEKVRAASGAS